ncbi:DUF7289 family protein [Halovivax gelatinilyticus]|uniref:DUF7289 family protein n=1 Tax=Halovivax gelatinilyticus TaxID=2961597 RepID=UPI0020CA3B99|nr:hypothetical protein [Halovivax gelatinilyticus]
MTEASRSQAEVLGVVMLLGLVSISALGLLLVGGSVVSDTQASAEKERIEQSFVQLSHAMSSATVDGERIQELEFDVGDSGAITKTDAGNISIEWGDEQHVFETIGAIEYEHEDGSVVAYQAGGVWAERGNETRMLSSPPVHYDARTETLTLPIATVTEQRDLSSGPVSIDRATTDPVPQANIVEDETVEMTIQSPYYRGWESYFETQGGEGVIRDVDHDNQSVTVQFGPLTFEDALDHGATYTSAPGGSHTDQIEENGQYGHLRPMDDVIDDLVDDANDGSLEIDRQYGTLDQTHNATFTNGTYLADAMYGGSHEVDLSDGNVTIIVDGSISSAGVTDFITVTDYEDGNELKIYSTGHLDIQNGGNICVEPCEEDVDASLIQIYGTSEMSVSINQGSPRYEGVIYAASDQDSWEYEDRLGRCDSDQYQFAFQANASFTGSIIGSTICGQSAAFDFSHHESLEDASIDPYPEGYAPPPHITYLNVAVFGLDVTN